MEIVWDAVYATGVELLSTDFGRGILGVLLGGLITLLATRIQLRTQAREARRAEKAAELAVRRGVAGELKNLVELHMAGISQYIEESRPRQEAPSGEPMFAQYYPVFSDYFTLFSRNAHLIGTLPLDAATAIIKAYVDLKAMVDTFRMNNTMLSRLEELQTLQATHPGVGALRDQLALLRGQLNDYGPMVVASHDRAMASSKRAMELLGV